LAQSRTKDIEEKEEARRYKKAQSSYGESKAPDECMTDFQVGSSFNTNAALLGGASNGVQRSNLAMHLQKTYGNQYVQRLAESLNVQAKLTVGSPDDEYERQADRVADAVTRAPASSVQRHEPELEEESQRVSVEAVSVVPELQRQEAKAPAAEAAAAPAATMTREKALQRWQSDVVMNFTYAWTVLGESGGKESERALQAMTFFNSAERAVVSLLPQYGDKPVLKSLMHLRELLGSASSTLYQHTGAKLSLQEIRKWTDPYGKPFGELMTKILPQL